MFQSAKKVWVLVFATVMLAPSSACSPSINKAVASGLIDVAVAACIAKYTDIEDEAALKAVCHWTEEMAPYVQELLSARKAGLVKKAGAVKCPEK
jgi:hypothetical protein